MLMEKYTVTPEQVMFSIIFSFIASIVSGIIYFTLILMLGLTVSPTLDFNQVSVSLIVSYLLISIVGVFVAIVVKLVFLKYLGYKYEGTSVSSEVISLVTMLVPVFVLSIPLFFLFFTLGVNFLITVLGIYIFYNFISVLYLSRGRLEFASILLSLYISVFLFFGLLDFFSSDAIFFLVGIFIFPIIFLGFSEIFLGIIEFFKLFAYRVYGIKMDNDR